MDPLLFLSSSASAGSEGGRLVLTPKSSPPGLSPLSFLTASPGARSGTGEGFLLSLSTPSSSSSLLLHGGGAALSPLPFDSLFGSSSDLPFHAAGLSMTPGSSSSASSHTTTRALPTTSDGLPASLTTTTHHHSKDSTPSALPTTTVTAPASLPGSRFLFPPLPPLPVPGSSSKSAPTAAGGSRGRYRCRHCGQLKRGHDCPFAPPDKTTLLAQHHYLYQQQQQHGRQDNKVSWSGVSVGVQVEMDKANTLRRVKGRAAGGKQQDDSHHHHHQQQGPSSKKKRKRGMGEGEPIKTERDE